MNITVNNEALSLTDSDLKNGSLNIEGLLELRKVESPDMVSVQHNGRILNREEFATVQLADGDAINFLYFMGGGE